MEVNLDTTKRQWQMCSALLMIVSIVAGDPLNRTDEAFKQKLIGIKDRAKNAFTAMTPAMEDACATTSEESDQNMREFLVMMEEMIGSIEADIALSQLDGFPS